MTSRPATEDRPSADGERRLRSDVLLGILARGGAISEARLIEDEDGRWTIRLRLVGEKGEYLVNKYESDEALRGRGARYPRHSPGAGLSRGHHALDRHGFQAQGLSGGQRRWTRSRRPSSGLNPPRQSPSAL